jgi:phospholipid/cholesterol/gamma-HCH transport system substrate-binding protein
VLAGTAFALLLTGGVFRQTYVVTADFADAAGLKAGDDVTVAGLDAGTVGSISVGEGVVRAELKIDDGIELSKDSKAEIVVETLLGKKSVRMITGPSDEALADGDQIPLARTETPVELLEIGNTSRPLLERSDAAALEGLMTDLTRITTGKRTEITALITGLADVTEAVDERSVELARLLDSFDTLGGTFADKKDTLVSLIDNLNIVLTNLEAHSTELERLLRATDSASHETAALVSRNRPELDSALGNLRVTLNVLDDHQLDLAALISYLEESVQGYSSVGYSQGTKNRWANIFVQSLGPLGVDAALGPCGALDQALDDLLGPDPRSCAERAEYGEPEGEGRRRSGGRGNETEPAPEPTDPETEESPLPGDVGDILDDVTGDGGLIDDLRGSLP